MHITLTLLQLALSESANGFDFILQPPLESVAAAAAAVVDELLTTVKRSLVVLSIPSLNVYDVLMFVVVMMCHHRHH